MGLPENYYADQEKIINKIEEIDAFQRTMKISTFKNFSYKLLDGYATKHCNVFCEFQKTIKKSIF